MRKVQLLLVGVLAMSSTVFAAVPQEHSSIARAALAPAPVVSTAAPAAPLTLAAVFSPAIPSSQVCNLLCIIGDHCCIIKGHPQCIPDSEACP